MTRFGSLIGVGSEEVVTIVNDTLNVVEDTTTNFDLFANDDGDWTVLNFVVPSGEVGVAGTTYGPGSTAQVIPGAGLITLLSDGTGSIDPGNNFNGTIPLIGIVCTGPGGVMRYSTLGVTVSAVNDPPTARDIGAVSIDDDGDLSDVVIDFAAAMSDPDGDAVTLTQINGVAVVFNTPIALDGGTLTIDSESLLGTIVPTPGREDPIEATYTCSDGTLTATGDITIIIAPVVAEGNYSPRKPHNPSDIHDVARVEFSHTFMQQASPLWPNIGPPDEEGNLSLCSAPPYSSGQGYFNLADREPWLYNRVRAAWLLWEITRDTAYRDYAIDLCETYMAAVTGTGTWTIIGGTGGDPQDVKYLYNEIATIYFKLTGSTVYYGAAEAIYNQTLSTFPAAYNAGSAELWTERHHGYALRNCMFRFYQSGGDTAVLDEATPYVDLILEMSEGTGLPLHGENKHEGTADTTPICSGFMGAILMEDMLQYWRHTRREDVLQWMYDNAVAVVQYCLYVADHNEEPEFAELEGLRIPAYIFNTTQQRAEGTAADMRHARDVAMWIDKGRFAGELLAEDVTDLVAARDELLAAALVDDNYWTRQTALYAWKRCNPPRCFAWLWAHFYALIYDTGSAPPILPVVLTNGVISGSTQQGATLTFTEGTQRGTPDPDVTWIWQLAGVDIAGTEDDLTYDTEDTGVHRVHVFITNEAGTVDYYTNTITVVPAGAPEVTVQPTGQSALVGDTDVEFICSFTGLPDPTAVVQIDSGSGFADTATGTLDHDTVGATTTATWNPGTITAPMDGRLIRFRVNNGVGGDVFSNSVLLSVISQQAAFRVTGAAQRVTVNVGAGTAGFLGWTWCGWVRMVTQANLAQVLTVEGVASRMAYLLERNTSNELTIGDSNTGPGNGVWTPQGGGSTSDPATGVWHWVTIRGPAAHPGVFHATYREAGTATTYEMTRANGIEDSVPVVLQFFGGGDGAGSTCEFQHLRLYSARLTDQQCIDEMTNFDPTEGVHGGASAYFLVADDGGGGSITDASGNAADIDITGATYTADGPLTGSV